MAAGAEMAAGEAASAGDEEIAAGEAASLALARQLHAAYESEMQAIQAQIASDGKRMLGYHHCE